MITGFTYLDFQTRDGLAPIDDPRDTYALRNWALAAGVDLLEDDDVVVKNGYVVPKVIVPGTAYVTTERLRGLSVMRRSRVAWDTMHWLDTHGGATGNKVASYLGPLPLRVVGVFADEEKYYAAHNSIDTVYQYVSTTPVHQMEFGPRGTRTLEQSVVVIATNQKQIGWTDVPKAQRRSMLTDICSSGPHSSLRSGVVRQVLESAKARTLHGVAYYKGSLSTAEDYVIAREACRRFAEIVRESIAGFADIDEAIGLIAACPRTLGDRLIDAWNDATGAKIMRGACGHIFDAEDGHDTRDGEVCESCFDEDYRHCEDTDDYRHTDTCYHHEDDDCYRSYPPSDDDDDDDDDDDGGLLNSWGASCSHLAHDVTFLPSPNGDFTMGIELEVQATGSRNPALRDCNDHFNRDTSYAMFKRDGSLSDSYGFEIVTAARRLNDHLIKFKEWEPEDLESWDAGCCGMHVHIDSRAFTPLSLGKFLMFYNQTDNHDFIRDIAGRHPDTDYGAKNYARKISEERTVSPIKVKRAGDNNSRYNMVNVTNLTDYEQDRLGVNVTRDSKGSYSTVEVRIFRGTLRKARLLAQIEFAHASVIFCRTASWQELDGDAFKFWLSKTAGYPNLRKWFGVFPSRNKQLVTASNEEDSTVEI